MFDIFHGNLRRLICISTLLFFAACTPKQVHPPLDVTFVPAKGDFISQSGNRLSQEKLLKATEGAAYILIGERHKNPCDHVVQQKLVSLLGSGDGQIAIGLEMIAVDKQPILNDFAKGQVPVDNLANELDWDARWGYPFSFFEGLFVLADKNSLPVGALNVPPGVAKTVWRKGLDALTEDQKDHLPKAVYPPPAEQQAFLDAMLKMHEGNSTNPEKRKNFFDAQSVWDSKMAEEAVRLRKTYNWPVVVIAGASHVENGWGIASRIRRLDRGAKIVLIQPYGGDNFLNTSADMFFYCPTTHTSRMGMVLVDNGKGVVVESVTRSTRAAKAGLRPGDVIIEAQGLTVHSLMDLHAAGVAAHKSGKPLTFKVRRGEIVTDIDLGLLTTKRTSAQK